MIRNCEEVGLFDDLQHVNPFDETFRRAVESDCGNESATFDATKCTKPKLTTQTTLEALTMHNEETLHTPNVLPYLESTAVSNKNLKTTISLDDEIMQTIGHSVTQSENMQEVGDASTTDAAKIIDVSNVEQNVVPQQIIQNEMKANSILLISTMATSYPISMQSTPNDTCSIERPLKKLYPKKVPVVEHPIKEKLKQLILRAKETTATTTAAPESNRPSVGKEKSIAKKRVNVTSVKSTVNSERLFERNRAAAQRYRVKVKKNQNLLHQRNAELEAENERLRTELKAIKTILLSHQDCSVTRGTESKPSIFYLVNDSKTKSENPEKS